MNRALRILLIDDNPEDRLLTIRELNREFPDLEVKQVSDLRVFEEAVQAGSFDLVITDYQLRWTDGLQILRSIKADHPDCPVIMSTATGTEEIAVEAMKRGLDDYVLKSPKHFARLPASVRLAIEKTKNRRAIEEMEARYRNLFEGVPVGLYQSKADGRLLDANPALVAMLGYPDLETLLGVKVADWYVNAEDRRQWQSLIERDGEALNFEVQLRRRDGSVIWGADSARAVLDNAGRALYYEGSFEDITERKHAEEAIRESEEMFRTLAESVSAGTYIYQGTKYVYVNAAAEAITGYTREELLSMDIWEPVHSDQRELVRERSQARQRGQQSPSRYEVKLLTKSGEARWTDTNVAPIRFHGEPAMLVTAFDITERKRAEEALKRAEQKYRSMIQNAVYGIYLSTLEGKFVEVNSALVAMLGYDSSEELLAADMATDIYFDPAERTRLIEQYRQVAHVEGLDVEWKRKDGAPITVRLNGRTVENERGEVEGFEMIVEDVTERRSLEDQLRQSQKMEAVGRLAGGVAHDFNNLLTAINGYAELMLARLAQDDPLYDNAAEIKKAGDRASMLTNQLLAFSRKQVIQPRVLDLNEVIEDSAKMLRRLISENIDIVSILKPELGLVRADPGQMEQALVNLAINSSDAMRDGGTLTIETDNVDLDESYSRLHIGARPGPHVMLSISDTGSGMDEETRLHIFEPFFTTKEKGKGTGLGLSTVYGIVNQSSGHIWVHSQPGKGSTFKIYLPRIEGSAEVISIKSVRERIKRGKETVLLVEDEEMVRRLARDILKLSGYNILEAANGGEAFLICEQHEGSIDLMVTDVVMPQMGGRELYERLSPMRPDMKVLYMSGYTDDAIVDYGVLSEGINFLQKPFSPDALARKVREVLDKNSRR